MSGPQALNDFEGRWALHREVSEARGPGGMFEGEAEFAPDGAGLRYVERGVLHLPGRPAMKAERVYLFRAAGQGIAVLFDDERPFHAIALGTARPKAAHWCDPDQYDVGYDFTAWPVWTARWQVRGPRKDYVMRSRYTRLS